jgi:outer membrane protein
MKKNKYDMKPMQKALTLILFITLFTSLNAQETQGSFTLKQALEYAVKHSPNQLNADLDIQAAEARRKEVRGLGLPQVNASADVKNYLVIPTSLIPAIAFNPFAGPDDYLAVQFGTKFNATAGLSASQLLFSSDYIFALKASKEYMNLSKISVTRTKSELAAQVTKAYYTVIINRDRIKLLDANITRLKKTYEDTKAFNQQGFVEKIDVERLEVAFNNLVTEKDKISRLIGLSETLLKFQMGYNLSDPIVLSDSLDMGNEAFQELPTGKIDITQRPDYQMLKTTQTLLDIDVKRWKWGYLPTLAAYGSYQYNSQRNQFDFFSNDKSNPAKQWYKIALIGATVNFNIFDGFQRHNKIQQAYISSQKNLNSIRAIELAGEFEATMASINYSNAFSSVNVQKKNMELAQHVYEVAQKKYEAGIGTNLEVVTAEASLTEAQTNYYNAVYDMLVAKIDYQKATGTLIK